MATKRGMISDMVERAVRETLREIAWSDGTSDNEREVLKRLENRIKGGVSMSLLYDKYRWLELCDIMAWRKRVVENRSTD